MIEKPIRSIIKTMTWRFTATLITSMITYFITHKLSYALSIASIDVILKLGAYYFHERFWNKIKFGLYKEYPQDYSI